MGESMATVPVGSTTKKNPDNASRIECMNICVAAVLSV